MRLLNSAGPLVLILVMVFWLSLLTHIGVFVQVADALTQPLMMLIKVLATNP